MIIEIWFKNFPTFSFAICVTWSKSLNLSERASGSVPVNWGFHLSQSCCEEWRGWSVKASLITLHIVTAQWIEAESVTPVLGLVPTLESLTFSILLVCLCMNESHQPFSSSSSSFSPPPFFYIHCSFLTTSGHVTVTYSHIPPNHQHRSLEVCLILWLWPCTAITDVISKLVGRVAQFLSVPPASSHSSALEVPCPGRCCYLRNWVHCWGRPLFHSLRFRATSLALFSCLLVSQLHPPSSHRS